MKNNLSQAEKLILIRSLSNKTKPNFSKISKELDISRKTLNSRLDKLREDKIINNFTINIHPIYLKYIIMEIKTNPNEPKLMKSLQNLPQLTVLDGLLGEYSLLAIFAFKDVLQFKETLKKVDKIMGDSYFKKYRIIEPINIYKTNGIRLSPFSIQQNDELDDIDFLLLRILNSQQEKKLLSTYELKDLLAEEHHINISQSTIYNRIKNMEKNDVILNYCVNFCPSRVGIRGKYSLRMKPKDPSEYTDLALKLEQNKHITDLFRIGEGLFAIVRVKQIKNYDLFLGNLYNTYHIEDTFSTFILNEHIPYTNFKLF
ncbi:MAG: winged helix-turn-helix transcriptional regulator [archaeon]